MPDTRWSHDALPSLLVPGYWRPSAWTMQFRARELRYVLEGLYAQHKELEAERDGLRAENDELRAELTLYRNREKGSTR